MYSYSKELWVKPDMVAHPWNLILGGLRQEDHCHWSHSDGDNIFLYHVVHHLASPRPVLFSDAPRWNKFSSIPQDESQRRTQKANGDCVPEGGSRTSPVSPEAAFPVPSQVLKGLFQSTLSLWETLRQRLLARLCLSVLRKNKLWGNKLCSLRY